MGVLAVAVDRPAVAQLTPRAVGKDFQHATTDVLDTWRAPLHFDGRDWRNVAIGAAGVALVSVVLDKPVDKWFAQHQESGLVRALRPFRDSLGTIQLVRAGTAPVLLPLSAGLYVAGLAATATNHDATGRDLRDAGLGCAAVNLTVLTVRYASYLLISRQRPRVAEGNPYNIDVPGGDWQHQSFISGHVANSTGCATFMNRRFDLGPAGPALYTVPVSIALGRFSDRRHWTSDITIGALLGVAVGTAIANRSAARLK